MGTTFQSKASKNPFRGSVAQKSEGEEYKDEERD
jgi:hypothetical protein